MNKRLAAKVLLKAKALLHRVKKPDPLAAEEADRGWPSRIWSDGGADSSLPPAYYSGPHGFESGGELQHEPGSGGGDDQ